MKYPVIEDIESWENKKERVLNQLKLKGEKFIQVNLEKLKQMEKNNK